jgi:hypothetical protein
VGGIKLIIKKFQLFSLVKIPAKIEICKSLMPFEFLGETDIGKQLH